jgi:hypothetical protein
MPSDGAAALGPSRSRGSTSCAKPPTGIRCSGWAEQGTGDHVPCPTAQETRDGVTIPRLAERPPRALPLTVIVAVGRSSTARPRKRRISARLARGTTACRDSPCGGSTEDLPQLRPRGLETSALPIRKRASSAVHVQIQHGHGGLKLGSFRPPALQDCSLEAARDPGRCALEQVPREIHGVRRLADLAYPGLPGPPHVAPRATGPLEVAASSLPRAPRCSAVPRSGEPPRLLPDAPPFRAREAPRTDESCRSRCRVAWALAALRVPIRSGVIRSE